MSSNFLKKQKSFISMDHVDTFGVIIIYGTVIYSRSILNNLEQSTNLDPDFDQLNHCLLL
jgi:hypothetical protein